jgi:hypothetical protein
MMDFETPTTNRPTKKKQIDVKKSGIKSKEKELEELI